MKSRKSKLIKLSSEQFKMLPPLRRAKEHQHRTNTAFQNSVDVLIQDKWIIIDESMLKIVLGSRWRIDGNKINTVKFVAWDKNSSVCLLASATLVHLIKEPKKKLVHWYPVNGNYLDLRAENIEYGGRPKKTSIRDPLIPTSRNSGGHKWVYFTSNPRPHLKVIVTCCGHRKFIGNFNAIDDAIEARNKYLQQLGIMA